MTFNLAFHVLAAVVWVGGMFFAYMVLRPAAGMLDPATRLRLWNRILSRFFVWVWLAIVVLLATGFYMVFAFFGGPAALRAYVRIMMMLGLLMTAIYLWVHFAPWRRFRRTVAREDWSTAQRHLNQIRVLIGLNLLLGLITLVVGASGRYFE